MCRCIRYLFGSFMPSFALVGILGVSRGSGLWGLQRLGADSQVLGVLSMIQHVPEFSSTVAIYVTSC